MESNKAFTIVELIVVITILAILGTIGFISFSSHLVGTRDTNRLSQLSAIHQGLDVYSTQNELPTPENSVEVKASGLLIGYQGYAGKNVLGMIQYSKGGKDPRDELYYSYYLTEDKKHFQLMGFLEDESNKQVSLIPKTNAADYTKRYPTVIGKKLGILTETGTNIPIQEVGTIVIAGYLDIVTTSNSYKAHFTDTDSITGTGINLSIIKEIIDNPIKSCLNILKGGMGKTDGIYTIDPSGTGKIEVYCDMTTDGGGWIKVSTKIDSNEKRKEFAQYINDNTSVIFNIDSCQECCTFPGYMTSPTNLDTGKNFCLYKLWSLYKIKADINTLTYSINKVKTHIGRNGLFIHQYWNGIGLDPIIKQIRSEAESDYTVYEEVLCK